MEASGQVFLVLIAEVYICLMWNASTEFPFRACEVGGQKGVLFYSDFTVLTEKQVARLTARKSAMVSATHTHTAV